MTASLSAGIPDPALDPPQTAAEPPRPYQQADRRTWCSFHCDCGRHFASLDAFDRHRTGSYKNGTRHCADPSNMKGRLVAKTEDGHCRLSATVEIHGVTIWQTREASEASWDA